MLRLFLSHLRRTHSLSCTRFLLQHSLTRHSITRSLDHSITRRSLPAALRPRFLSVQHHHLHRPHRHKQQYYCRRRRCCLRHRLHQINRWYRRHQRRRLPPLDGTQCEANPTALSPHHFPDPTHRLKNFTITTTTHQLTTNLLIC